MKHYKIHNKLKYGTIFRRVKAWNRIQDRKIRIDVMAHELYVFNYDKWEYEYYTFWKDKVELVTYINMIKKMAKSKTYDYYPSDNGRLPTLDKQVASML